MTDTTLPAEKIERVEKIDTTGTAPTPTAPSRKGMVRVPGGEFRMGSEDFYPEERPVRPASVAPFWIDTQPVTVAEFRRFVKATGYVTLAERVPVAEDLPTVDAADLAPGALVFRMTPGPVDLRDWRQWWEYVPGADWRRPRGPGTSANGLDLHPVTQVAYDDATAYAAWAGKELPTETEWEFAARGGLDGATYAWGDEFAPKGRTMANTWHGEFPWEYAPPRRARAGTQPGTTPVRSYPANGYGLFDVAGNVWEWTADYYTVDHGVATPQATSCCAPSAVVEPGESRPRRVTKGGSHLCAPNYCHRYRPSARQGQTEDTATCHLGFRCVVRCD